MGDMDNRICYYANKSFFDRDSKSYFVAKITENEAGYTQTSWAYSEPTKAQEEADRLNANLGWTRDDVLDIVGSAMRASPMSKRPLFDVTISVFRDEATGEGVYDVLIIDRYHKVAEQIGQKYDMSSLDEAIEFAKGGVTAFMQGTAADE